MHLVSLRTLIPGWKVLRFSVLVAQGEQALELGAIHDSLTYHLCDLR